MAERLHAKRQPLRELHKKKLQEQGLTPAAWADEEEHGGGGWGSALGEPPPYMEPENDEPPPPGAARAAWQAANRHSIWRRTGSALGTAASYGAAGVAYTAGALLNVGAGAASGVGQSARELLAPEHYDIHSAEPRRHRSMERTPAHRPRASSPPRGDGISQAAQAIEGTSQQAVPAYLLDREESHARPRMSMVDKERIRYREQATMRGEHAFKFGRGR
jgi:hypothetical protein